MNKKGFTLTELLATIVIIAFIMMIIYPSITKLIDNNDKQKYSSYERMMVEYAAVHEDQTSDIINLDDLDELDEVKNACDGYVDRVLEKAYIKCGDKYQTDGFDSSKVN